MAHACNPGTQKAKAGRLGDESQHDLHGKMLSQNRERGGNKALLEMSEIQIPDVPILICEI